MRWIAGAAVAVGAFVAAAVCSSGPPQVLDLEVTAHRVVFAENHQQAIAKASEPVAPREVASKPAPARTQKLARNQLPQIPAHGSIMAAAAPAASSVLQGGSELARPSAKVDTHRPKPLAFTGAQVTEPPRTDVLIAARPSRGPPTI